MNLLEDYLRELREIRSSGEATDETSYYTPLNNLLDEVGRRLKPRVRCILQLKNRGAGHPDGGLYTADQFQTIKDNEPIPGQKPARGAIEVKATGDDAWVSAETKQVTDYWKAYGQVLVTNYRDFVLVGRDLEGKPLKLASYRLAPDAKAFWQATATPKKTARDHGDRFLDFLQLAMLSPAPMSAPKDLAWVLAYYAREAKSRVESQAELAALAGVRGALEQALGLKFEGQKGEHFFRSSLVQTLFYGVFSAWVLWSKLHPPTSTEKFDWKLAQWSLRVPMIRVLFEQVATPGNLGPLDLVEVLNWTAAALNRVDRAEFFSQFQEQQALQYFYEPFLQAFDPELRKQLGVWYTPVEVVKYMVARTDCALREELGLEDGLADKRVYVLDPGCGTGAYLVEVLKTIAATLKAKGDDALAAHDVKRAAMERVFGFEILPAPFVVSHLQLGLLLQNLGAPVAEDGTERVGVYLTNSLTGWEPPKGPKQHLIFPEMEAEREAADIVKREKPILVVIGNPPYNAYAGVSPAEEEGLVEPYKSGLVKKWHIKKFNLDDPYIRFFRLAERRIAEGTGKGVISYISNFSYLADPSFVVMRKRFLDEFDRLWFDCMNGDSRETGKLTPDGKPDPSVFSTEGNPEGIRIGTAIALLVRRAERAKPEVKFRHFWGVKKRSDLLDSLAVEPFDSQYQQTSPKADTRYSFRPSAVGPHYTEWPRVIELCREPPSNGLMEKRGGSLIDIDRDALRERMQAYLNPKIAWHDYKVLGHGLSRKQARFDPVKARQKILAAEQFTLDRIVKYAIRPFDVQWCYYTGVRPVWNEPRPRLWKQAWPGNLFLLTRFKAEKYPEGPPFYYTQFVCDDHFLAPDAVAIPMKLKVSKPGIIGGLFGENHEGEGEVRPNLSDAASAYLESCGVGDANSSTLLWMHVLAIGFSPVYLRENADGVRNDWPRIPFPENCHVLLSSASLGQQLANLLNTAVPAKNVTSGTVRAELKVIANVITTNGKPLDPANDLKIEVGWGHANKGAVMPGTGKLVQRDYSNQERESMKAGAAALGLPFETLLTQLGEVTCDIYLNDRAHWRNVPIRVWEYTIGGYQVIKKWLSYRELKLLGRAITPEEAREIREMARRIAAICLLEPQLDANYATIKAHPYRWPRMAAEVAVSTESV